MPFNILAFSGSGRTLSTNERIVMQIAASWKPTLEIEIYPSLADLPIFTPDRDTASPPEVIRDLREKISRADGILICTPEYVFSPPAAVKNFLEWMVSVTVLSDKPAALIVAAAAGEKTFESLTLILTTLGVKANPATRVLIQGARSKVSADGTITDEPTASKLRDCIEALIALLPAQ